MANFFLRIDNSDVKAFTKKLEQLHRSALPGAIRGTLNAAAFDVKQKTMPVSADKHFEHRKPNFFKANSKVVVAKGWSVEAMKATVGFTPTGTKYNNHAVSELEQQEHGGVIHKRTFIPVDQAREGNSNSGEIKSDSRLKSINNIVFSDKIKGRDRKQKFLLAAMSAGAQSIKLGKNGRRNVTNGFVVGNMKTKSGGYMMYKINAITRFGGKTKILKTPLYSYIGGRSVKIKKATAFMKEASLNSAAKLEKFYIQEAKYQVQRLISKGK